MLFRDPEIRPIDGSAARSVIEPPQPGGASSSNILKTTPSSSSCGAYAHLPVWGDAELDVALPRADRHYGQHRG
jgi:hypothetical protein